MTIEIARSTSPLPRVMPEHRWTLENSVLASLEGWDLCHEPSVNRLVIRQLDPEAHINISSELFQKATRLAGALLT